MTKGQNLSLIKPLGPVANFWKIQRIGNHVEMYYECVASKVQIVENSLDQTAEFFTNRL